jgi:hypothetical protein
MKYTHYILNDAMHFEQFGIIAIPAAVVSMPVLVWFLGGAVLMDSGRYVKLQYLVFKREQHNVEYIKYILRSLDAPESKKNIQMLKAA